MSHKLDKISLAKKYVLSRSRVIVQMSSLIRDLNLRSTEREKIIDTLRDRLRVINELEEKKKKSSSS